MKKFILKSGLVFTGIVFAFVLFPKFASAATIYLSPAFGSFGVGSTFNVTVQVNTQDAAVNTAESNITFTSDTLELLEVNQGSTFLLPAPGSPNKGYSSAYFGGGLPNPGYNGKTGVLGTMKFKARAIGPANISITRGNILLNDGTGRQALTSMSDASFVITAGPVGAVVVSSTTHPTENSWSNRNYAELRWTLPDKAYGVSYSLDQNPAGLPDDTIDVTTVTTISYQNIKDGTWYFHIKARGKNNADPFGPITTYKIQVDTVAPLPFSIHLLGQTNSKDASNAPTIAYEAQDATSGVYRYEIYLDNHLVKELTASSFAFPKIEARPHTIRVVAYDRAGNKTAATLPLNIVISGQQLVTFDYVKKYLQLPLYGLILVNLLIFLTWWIRSRLRLHRNVENETQVNSKT
ncbi:MAG TPA: cohesin domain-containing protein [Patescibacteria group bacterium]